MEVRLFDDASWRVVRLSVAIPSLLAVALLLVSKAAKKFLASVCPRAPSEGAEGTGANGVGAGLGAASLLQDAKRVRLVEEKLLLVRLERTKRFCHVLMVFITPHVYSWVLVSVQAGRKPINSQVSDIIVFLILDFCILVFLRPAIMTFRVMEMVTSSLPVLFGVIVSPIFVAEETASLHFMLGNFALIILCLVRQPRSPKKAPVFCLSILCLGACCASNLWHFLSCGWINPTSSTQKFDVVLGQIGVILAALWSGSLCERSSRQLLTTSLHLEEVRGLYAAASALLSYSFDVVVEVDDGGSLVCPTPELSSLLLQPSKELQGTQLADLFTLKADRLEFLQRLCSPNPEGQSLLESMAVGMQDANGFHLSMELLWFGFCRHGKRCFMVGLRECSSDGLRVPGTSEANDNDVRSEHSSASTGSDELSTTGDWERCDSEPAIIILDAEKQGYPIKSVSTSFILQFGRVLLGRPFLRCVKRPKQFEEWVQELSNFCMHDMLSDCGDLTVRLRLHHGTVTARCSLVLPAQGEELDLENLSIFFSHLPSSTRNLRRARADGSGDLRGTPFRRHLEPGPDLQPCTIASL